MDGVGRAVRRGRPAGVLALASALVVGVVAGLPTAEPVGAAATVTRAEALRALWLAAGAPQGYPAHGIDDVAPGARWLRWAVAEGVVPASATGRFGPSGATGRQDLLRWLWRAEGSPRAGAGADGEVTAYPGSGGVAGAWARAEGVVGAEATRGRLTRTDLRRWTRRWAAIPPAGLVAGVRDTNLVTLQWRARTSATAADQVAAIEPGIDDEPALDLLPVGCPGDGWCRTEVRTGSAGWVRFTLTVAAADGGVQEAAAEVRVARPTPPVVPAHRVVVDALAPGARTLTWSAPPGVAPDAPLATDFVQVFPPRSLLPLADRRPVEGSLALPGPVVDDQPATWTLRRCRTPDGVSTPGEPDAVCSANVQVTFDPEGAQFTGVLAEATRVVLEPGEDVDVTWSGPGDHWRLSAPTLLPAPVDTTTPSLLLPALPEGVHPLRLVSCAGPCPDDVSGREAERRELVVGLAGEVPHWERRSLTEDHDVEVVDLLERPTVGEPLDVALGRNGSAWVVGEFGAYPGQVRAGADGGPATTHHEPPQDRVAGRVVGPFANPFHTEAMGPDCGQVAVSALAERVVTTRDGVWFTHGGALFAPEACRAGNASRVVRFDPDGRDDPTTAGDDRFCAVTVPWADAQVVGVAHDHRTGRLWFSSPGGADGPAVAWFDLDELACRAGTGTVPVQRVPTPGLAPAHLALDPGGEFLWISDYSGQWLGRLPTDADGDTPVLAFPLPRPLSDGFLSGFPWQLRATADAVYVVEYADNQVVRFDTTVPDPEVACTRREDDGNPCMREVFLPVPTDTVTAHSIDVVGDRLWFTVADEPAGVEAGGSAFVGWLDLSTWDGDGAPAGVLYADLDGDLGPPVGRDHRAPRGIDVDGATGRVAVAEMGRELLLLTPRSSR